MSTNKSFSEEFVDGIKKLSGATDLQKISLDWITLAGKYRYAYHFSSLGRPAIQVPQDMIAMQEIIWSVRPDIIIETGIAHGGSLVHSAAALTLLDYCDAQAHGSMLDPQRPKRRVIGIDIDIRQHNRAAIDGHPMRNRIDMIEGSSIEDKIVSQVHARVSNFGSAPRVLVCLDSNHTHEHVLHELNAYAGLVSIGSYCVVFDTLIERLPATAFPDRPWAPGNSPMSAVDLWLRDHPEFVIDTAMDAKLQISVAPRGYLKRVA